LGDPLLDSLLFIPLTRLSEITCPPAPGLGDQKDGSSIVELFFRFLAQAVLLSTFVATESMAVT